MSQSSIALEKYSVSTVLAVDGDQPSRTLVTYEVMADSVEGAAEKCARQINDAGAESELRFYFYFVITDPSGEVWEMDVYRFGVRDHHYLVKYHTPDLDSTEEKPTDWWRQAFEEAKRASEEVNHA